MNQVPMWSRIMVALCCVYRGALGQPLMQVVVDPVSGVNFSLYGENKEWTWARAYNHCVSVGQRLAVIDNPSKQEAVNRFTDIGDAWIGGRRSTDVIWRWISGEEYEYDDMDAYLFEHVRTRCGALRAPWLHPHGCVGLEELRAICQQGSPGAGQRYWVTDVLFTSWLAARASCLAQDADLAHPSYQQQLQDWKKDINGTADPKQNLWIGLSRHPWSWVTGDHTTLQAYRSMTYTHFSRGEGDGSNQSCVYLDNIGNNDNSWAENACDFPSRYFVCDDGPPLPMMSQPRPARPTETPPGADCPHQTEAGLSTTGTAGQAPDVAAVYRMLWVTVGVCVILVVAIIIIITFLLIKNRRLKKAGSAAMATVPVAAPPAAVQHEPSSPDNEGSYGNLRTSQIESRDPEPYERLGDGAHYDLVGDPETGAEANGGRRIYQNVD